MSAAIMLAITAHLFWASGMVVSTALARCLTALEVLKWRTLILLLLLAPLLLSQHYALTVAAVSYTALMGLLLYTGNIMFQQALRTGSAQTASATAAVVPALITVLSVVFLNGVINTLGYFLLALITFGLLLISWPAKHAKVDRSTIYAFAAVLLWGVYFSFITISIKSIGPIWTTYISALASFIMLQLLTMRSSVQSKPAQKLTRNTKYLLFTSAVLTGGAPLIYSFALKFGTAATVAPIATSYAALTILISSIVFKDKVSKRKWLGIIVTVISVLMFILTRNY